MVFFQKVQVEEADIDREKEEVRKEVRRVRYWFGIASTRISDAEGHLKRKQPSAASGSIKAAEHLVMLIKEEAEKLHNESINLVEKLEKLKRDLTVPSRGPRIVLPRK